MTNWKSDSNSLWSIILAGGEGQRMRPMVQRWLGRHRPKQYCTFVGTRSMFQHTLDRAAKLTEPERIMAVVGRHHARDVMAQVSGRTIGTLLFQPDNRNTAAGVFLPLTYVRACDPRATVMIFPSDHFVYPEQRFLEVVKQAVSTVSKLEDRLILLGIRPDRLEQGYGWVHPADVLVRTDGEPVRAVHSFLEKPSSEQAETALYAGALWNTLVLVARVGTLWNLGLRYFPFMMSLFEKLDRVVDCPVEAEILKEIYRDMPSHNFSSDLLQHAVNHMAVLDCRGVLWSDWGQPERIARMLNRIGRVPAFPLEFLEAPMKLSVW